MNAMHKPGAGGRPTRCESSARRRAVLEVAKERFLSVGYRETSLDDIAREAGVAKKTLYGHFGSKAQLFKAILESLRDAWQDELRHIVIGGGEPAEVLENAALHLLDIGTREDMVELYWVLLGEARRFPALAEGLYDECGQLIGMEPLGRYLQESSESGKLRLVDVQLAAEQFVHLVLGGVRARMLLGVAGRPDLERRRVIAKEAVRIFIAGCATR
jgi:TetR/AcrR family transcriptional regulator, mexJK operon transcriptional repressor